MNVLTDKKEIFILNYRAALKAKLTRNQLAAILNMETRSVSRRRQELKQLLGLDLPELPLDDNKSTIGSITPAQVSIFSKEITLLKEKTQKNKKINSGDNITVDIVKNKKYIVTSAQNGTPVNRNFLKSLELYAKANDAELVVIPYRYKNPTSLWTGSNISEEWWDKSVTPYLMEEEYKIGKHIRIMGHIKIQPTATSPLSGFETVTNLDSAIFGHPNVEWKTIASAPTKSPKILATTGSVTIPNYTDSKAGHKGAYHHNYSAAIIEIDDSELFHLRHVSTNDSGIFYDLDKCYNPNGEITESNRALALVAGDIHAEVVDEKVVDALYLNDDSVANLLQPENFVFHDIIDFAVRSHHNIRDSVGRFRKHFFSDNNNVEEALQKTADFIELVSRDGTKNRIVKSNHDEHIDRWLKEADPATDPENAKLYYYLKYNQLKAISENPDKNFDILEFWCKNPESQRGLKRDGSGTHFLKRDESFEMDGIELALHGDQGPNGSRGSLRNLSRIGQRVIIGHSHTPGISNGSYQVGTTSALQLEYNKGPSSWLQTAAIVYPDGNVTLINVIEGKWKL